MNHTQPYTIHTDTVRNDLLNLHAGESVLLSGTIYTARDAAHKKLCALIREKMPLPFELRDAVIYYAGPTPTRTMVRSDQSARPHPPEWMHLRQLCLKTAWRL